MCGRLTLTQADPAALSAQFGANLTLESAPLPRYNLAPSQSLLIVRQADDDTRHFDRASWGLIPSWAKDASIANRLTNARGESVHEKPSFRAAFAHRRCLVVADGFYEWRKNADGSKTPFHIHLKGHAPFGLAGLWETWQDCNTGEIRQTTTLITTSPNALIASIHDRMPVIVATDDYAHWLNPRTPQAEVRALLTPYPAETMQAYAVSSRVNRPLHDDAALLAPIATDI